jgi:hypothetical protein
VDPHMLPWPAGLAYAGAAPITATATMQLVQNSLYLMVPPFPGARLRTLIHPLQEPRWRWRFGSCLLST